ncbi:unnamed protein product [Linum tenue]|uniref:Uncharacterized protein n=1 Tax=Linum tenue TaxID=586396 RepID=A0AAV0MEH2_9ROSI|nr:unnamed protein product [Linum tenue]
MSGKGAKGLMAGKAAAQSKDKDKKKPTSRSSRAGLQGAGHYNTSADVLNQNSQAFMLFGLLFLAVPCGTNPPPSEIKGHCSWKSWCHCSSLLCSNLGVPNCRSAGAGW